MSKKLTLIVFTTTVLLVAFGFTGKALAANYLSPGVLTSTDLLAGLGASSIVSFYYNIALPSGTSARVQYSVDGGGWVKFDGTAGWDNCADGGMTVPLGWSGSNFRYRMEFNSNAARTLTPALESVTVEYAVTPTYTPEKTMVGDSSGSDTRGGVVSAGSISFPNPDTDPEAISARSWVLTGYGSDSFPTYSELQTMYDYTNATEITDLSPAQMPSPGVYKITTGYTISSSPCTLPDAVVFVDGTLDITTDFGGTVSGDPVGFKNGCNASLAFIVSGDINIASDVNNIYGIFYAAGSSPTGIINTGSGATPLYVFGSLLANSFTLGRNLGAGNATSPAEQIIYMPQYFITLKNLLGRSQVSWKEVK